MKSLCVLLALTSSVTAGNIVLEIDQDDFSTVGAPTPWDGFNYHLEMDFVVEDDLSSGVTTFYMEKIDPSSPDPPAFSGSYFMANDIMHQAQELGFTSVAPNAQELEIKFHGDNVTPNLTWQDFENGTVELIEVRWFDGIFNFVSAFETYEDNWTTTTIGVPEPSGRVLLMLAALLAGGFRRRFLL